MLTIIDAGRANAEELIEFARLTQLSEGALREALGWELHEGTLCNDTMCVPLPAGSSLGDGGLLDLAEVAGVLDRPLALDAAEGAAYLGASARERADALASLVAPDFTLPDLDGRPHSLAEQRGQKVLLVVWASW